MIAVKEMIPLLRMKKELMCAWRSRLGFILAVLLMLGISHLAGGQNQARLEGSVRHALEGRPLVGVQVALHHGTQHTRTDAKGHFELPLAPGHYHLHFTKPGYEAVEVDLHFPEDQKLDITMMPSYIELQEVVVEESDGRAGRETSREVLQIYLGGAEQAGAASLAQSLEKQAGLQSLNTGVGIAKPVIRGLMGSRVAVLDQGVQQEGQQWGQDHGLALDPLQVRRVQVIKGAAALQYGSGAIGGVIKVQPDPVPDSGWHGQLRGIYQSNNYHRGLGGRLSWRRGRHFFILNASGQQYQDFRVPARSFVYNGFRLPITDNTLKNTAGKLASARLQYGYLAPGYHARYTYSHYWQEGGLYPGATGIPRAYDVGVIGDGNDVGLPRQEVRHQKWLTRQHIKLGKHWLEIDAGYQQNVRAERSLPHNHGFEELDSSQTLALGLRLQTAALNARYNWHTEGVEFTLGGQWQYQRNEAKGFEYLIPSYGRSESGLYLTGQGDWGQKWHWSAGLRGQHGTLASPRSSTRWWNDFDSVVLRSPRLNRQFLSYALSAGLSFTPSPRWHFKLHLARPFRIPVVAELASNGVHHGTFRHEMGQPDLSSEQGWQVDMSGELVRPQLLVRLSPFASLYENFIYLQPSGRFSQLPDAGQVYQYQQAPVSRLGGEVYLDWHPLEPLHLEYSAEYLWTQNHRTGLGLPFTPPFSQRLSLRWGQEWNRHWRWEVSLAYRHTAAQNRTARNEQATPGYQLLQGGAQITWERPRATWALSFRGQNLTNAAYLKHLSRYRILNLPEQGRNLIFQLSYKF